MADLRTETLATLVELIMLWIRIYDFTLQEIINQLVKVLPRPPGKFGVEDDSIDALRLRLSSLSLLGCSLYTDEDGNERCARTMSRELTVLRETLRGLVRDTEKHLC